MNEHDSFCDKCISIKNKNTMLTFLIQELHQPARRKFAFEGAKLESCRRGKPRYLDKRGLLA